MAEGKKRAAAPSPSQLKPQRQRSSNYIPPDSLPRDPLLQSAIHLGRLHPSASTETVREALVACNGNTDAAAAKLEAEAKEAARPAINSSISIPPAGREPVVKKRFEPDLSTPHKDLVTIHVGKDQRKREFSVHKDFICYYSPYFEEALNGNSLGSQAHILIYEDTTPEAFGLFVRWIYSKTIKDTNGELPPVTDMVTLWLLADHIEAPKLQNLAIRGIFARGCVVPVHDFTFIYDSTTPESPLRRLLIDQLMIRKLSYQTLAGIIKNQLLKIPVQMLADLVLGQKKILQGFNLADGPQVIKVEQYLVKEGAIVPPDGRQV